RGAGVAAVRARQGGPDHGRARGAARREGRAHDRGRRMSALLRDAPHLVPMTVAELGAVVLIEAAAYDFPWTRGNFIDSLAAGYLARVLFGERRRAAGYFVAMHGVDEMHLL